MLDVSLDVLPLLFLCCSAGAEEVGRKVHFRVYWAVWTDAACFVSYLFTFPPGGEAVNNVIVLLAKSKVGRTVLTNAHGFESVQPLFIFSVVFSITMNLSSSKELLILKG